MLAAGNADPQICISNLLQTHRKEAFYGRMKGVSSAGVDMPFSSAEDQITSDAEDMLERYEKRVIVNSVYFETDEEDGDFILAADLDLNIDDYMSKDEEDDYE